MRKKVINLGLIVLLLTVSLFLTINLGVATYSDDLPEYLPDRDAGRRIRQKTYPIRTNSESNLPFRSGDLKVSTENYTIGDTLTWLVLDDFNSVYIPMEFQLRGLGDLTEVWVQTDLSFPDNRRDAPVITDTQITYVINEFESNIYPITTEYFGEPEMHYGVDANLGFTNDSYYDELGRNVILVSNIRDESFYDPSYPYYIVGFYSPQFETDFDRNIISIDAYAWETRLGEPSYMYDATIAHEYQHLIHDDYQPEDDLFLNEGCSMYAEPLCGYPIAWGDINSFLYTPDNSLVEWGDQGGINILADYGQGLLWTIYLSDHYGGADFISHFVKSGIPGIAGINDALEYFGYQKTFEDVFYDWRIANLIHTDSIGGGLYNYQSIDLNSENAIEATMYKINRPWFPEQTGTDFGTTKTDLHQDTGIALLGGYACDYIQLSGLKESFNPTFHFDGDDVALAPIWSAVDQDGDGDYEWYSTNVRPESDIKMWYETILPEEPQITLTFDTNYIIEEHWDFGFIQISTDNGETWLSLENEYTRYDIVDDGYPAIKENLPGLTGDSGGWISMSFDLSPYAGQNILLSFRYMTDWAYEDLGWYVDNIAINGDIVDNADQIINFQTGSFPENDYIVTLIETELINEIPVYNEIVDISLTDLDEMGSISLLDYINPEGYVLIIISPKLGPADYKIELSRA
jgi:hypothetical protein